MATPPDLRGVDSSEIRYLASTQTGRTVSMLAQAAAKETGQQAFTPDSDGRLHPIAGWWASNLAAGTAAVKAREYLALARGQGMSWQAIGEAMLHDGAKVPAAETAFHRALGNSVSEYVYWRCGGDGGCGERITDLGPVSARPDDCESGHTEGCGRHAGEIAAYRKQLED